MAPSVFGKLAEDPTVDVDGTVAGKSGWRWLPRIDLDKASSADAAIMLPLKAMLTRLTQEAKAEGETGART